MTDPTNPPNACGGYLKIYCEDAELRAKYQHSIDIHNADLLNNIYADAGFDLFIPQNISVKWHSTCKVDLKIKTAMFLDYKYKQPIGFLIYPRSSIANTSLSLANHVAVIDAGYRGNIKLAFRNHNTCPTLGQFSIIDKMQSDDGYHHIEQFDRLGQICLPNLMPIHIMLVDSEKELGMNTERGAGAYGSTGR